MPQDTTLALNADQKAVASRHIDDIIVALSTAAQTIAKDGSGRDPVGLLTNCLKVTEFNLVDLGKILGVELDTAAEREQRFADLRKANRRVHELEACVGKGQDPAFTQLSLRAMSEHLRKWWKHEGFGHVSDVAFGAYGCQVKFSCSLFGGFSLLRSATPVSDKTRKEVWHDDLRARGFILVETDGEMEVADTQQSRDTLLALFSRRLSSSTVSSLHSTNRRNQPGMVLNEIGVYIGNIAEITQLPVAPREPAQTQTAG